MNEMTTTDTGTAIALPAPTDLAALFKEEDGISGIISKLEVAARADAAKYDATTKKGRDALISLAAKVSKSKAELDRQGKALTDAQRKEINAVNAGRKIGEERLAALRDEIRKPVTDWEAAEEARTERHKRALDVFDLNRADANSAADQVRNVRDDIEAMTTGPEWDEFQPIAEAKKAAALAHYRSILTAAEEREAERAELARLRAQAEERARRDAYQADVKAEAERQAQAKYEADLLAAEKAEADRIAAEQAAKRKAECQAQIERDKAEAAERAQKKAEELAARAAKEAAERHALELAEAKAREDASSQRERDRIAAEFKAEADARAKREADQAHRTRIRNEIAAGLKTLEAGNWYAIADALIDGKIPHTEVLI